MGSMQRLFQLMADKKASDIFVSVDAPINIKINGVAVAVNQQIMDAATIMGLLQEVLTDLQLREFAETLELNVGYALPGVGNFRISAMRQKGTPAFVVRYIPTEIPRLAALNMPPVLADIIMEKRGLVLLVGATGSGKTTTITAMLDHRNESCSGHILTLEEPIEFVFKNRKSIVNQREIGADTRDFHVALKNALRQAPDCIFIGEIRDQETMTQAIAYAQTGHLCLATLHANNSYHSLSRIISFYPLETRPALLADLAATLKCVISQRLVKRPDGARIPAAEVLLNSRYVGELIENGDLGGIKEAMEQSLSPGSITFEQSLFALYKSGVITLEEALGNADSANNLHWLINNAGADKQLGDGPRTPLAPAEAEASTSASGASFSKFTMKMD
ncbi:MAG: PilT/PilU family type 4a pilus ATPase [Rhodocyclaceae bacterium]|jgi:twitching motility protein PilU|nr:PilT/PilU family type 4a pilus ATPase [Rhodocyclaceae bacterium]